MIVVTRAREHNLKNINLQLPDNKLIVVTGVSGSGKSTLVYDVIYQEARRRYLETFSSYARTFMGKLHHPEVDYLGGLKPAIALAQQNMVNSPRSTVGTLSELYDLLRLLFARFGQSPNTEIKLHRSLFSFNSPEGACEHCKGLGVEDSIDPELLIAHPGKTIHEGAFTMTTPSGYIVYSQVTMDVLNEVCQTEGFTVDIPWNKLTAEQQHVVLYGSNKLKVPFGKHTLESRMKWTGITVKPREEDYYKGIVPTMEDILRRDRNGNILRFARTRECSACAGSRLNANARQVRYREHPIDEMSRWSLTQILQFVKKALSSAQSNGEQEVLKEMVRTLETIQTLGLGYLSMSRSSESLSGSETQRLRMAKMVNTQLRGILYIFDEPSVGLHPAENANLLRILRKLRDNGNTVIMVEHNPYFIAHADWIVDMGPMAGEQGGEVIYSGLAKNFFTGLNPDKSRTLQCMQQKHTFRHADKALSGSIRIQGITKHNLNGINIELKTGALNLITGPNGAGKSTLLHHVIAPYFSAALLGEKPAEKCFSSITGHEAIDNLLIIDQSPIGKTPRSNPATYTGLADELRNLFSTLPEAQTQGLAKSHFSFNTAGGRCEACEGAGYISVGSPLLGTIETECEICNGKQFKPDVLTVLWQGKSIADILQLTIHEAAEIFAGNKKIEPYLHALQSLGLGYLTLNQRSSTLSGGEARRVKLAKYLAKPTKKASLFIIDEPSSGLHLHDVEVLLQHLEKLAAAGHTIVMVEQHPLFVHRCHHLIELGLVHDSGSSKVLYQGFPSGILQAGHSLTAKYLEADYTHVASAPNLAFNNTAPIRLNGVSTHNLQNIDVEIPLNKLTVLCGVSGSGKSSLAFDTLFTEGRQRYAESFSAYMRTRLNLNSEARFDSVRGLSPTVAIHQNSITRSPRSTVGTVTGIFDHLRWLFSRAGNPEKGKTLPPASGFSFNHQSGACPHCHGLGIEIRCDGEKLVAQPELSLAEGAMSQSKPGKFYSDPFGQYMATLYTIGSLKGIDFSQPWCDLPDKAKDIALFGTGETVYEVNWEYKRNNTIGSHQFKGKWEGFFELINREYLRKSQDKRAEAFESIMSECTCSVCGGSRLNPTALSVTLNGKTIDEICQMEISEALPFFISMATIAQTPQNQTLEKKIIMTSVGRIILGLDTLKRLGLGYLSLSRGSQTLSGGEGQRVRLASCLTNELSGLTVILDEPTTGLHPQDTTQLYLMIRELVKQGNTVVVCEHDPEFIGWADHVIELGPGGGTLGGRITAKGTPRELLENKESATAKYLQNPATVIREKQKLTVPKHISIKQANAHNLKNADVRIPLNCIVAIAGVSGSGKTSLVRDVLFASAEHGKAMGCSSISGLEKVENVLWVDAALDKQHAGSYVMQFAGIAHKIGEIFAQQQEARNAGLKKNLFSPNSKLGQCPECKGKGEITLSLDFIADSSEPCTVCRGDRFTPEVSAITFKEHSISEVMKMSIEQLGALFCDYTPIVEFSSLAQKLGLAYLTCGQSLNTLSGGERQRLKILKRLSEIGHGAQLFLLDEPSTGLHMQDVERLIEALSELVKAGHSVVVIEHNRMMLSNADHILYLGPGAGEKGGKVSEREFEHEENI